MLIYNLIIRAKEYGTSGNWINQKLSMTSQIIRQENDTGFINR